MAQIGPFKVGFVDTPQRSRGVGLVKSWPAMRTIGVAVHFQPDKFWTCFFERGRVQRPI